MENKNEIPTATKKLTKMEIKTRVYNEALDQVCRLEIDAASAEKMHIAEPNDKEIEADYLKNKKRLLKWATILEITKQQLEDLEKEELSVN